MRYTQQTSPRASINLSAVSGGFGTYYPTNGTQRIVCAGASLRAAGTDGVLVVHPVDNAVGDNYPLDLTAGGGPVGFEFDAIIETGTTVTLSNVDIFPKVLFSQTL